MGVLSLRGKPRWAAAGSSALLATSALMLSSLASAAPATLRSAATRASQCRTGSLRRTSRRTTLTAGCLADQSRASGAKFLSLAFLQTPASRLVRGRLER